jgi:hypothetical protein
MRGPKVTIAASLVLVTLSGAPAFAAHRLHPVRRPPVTHCCSVPAGTQVEVQLVDEVSTRTQKSGGAFDFRLAAPLIVRGEVVLASGTPGVGVIVESARPSMGGKGAKLVLAASYLRRGQQRVPLEGFQLAAAGRDNSVAAQAAGMVGGLAFAPLGFVGLAIPGGNVGFPAGTTATAKVADAVILTPLRRASRQDMASAAAMSAAANFVASDVVGAIDIPPPPAGKGEVVFFRDKSLLGAGQWFKVRENGKALGKLTNGAYFVQVTDPGLHTYTATEEPELKDRLKLEVDRGETYFVRGTLTKGVVVGAADLTPSNRVTFDRYSRRLKLAHNPPAELNADQPASSANNAPDASSDSVH